MGDVVGGARAPHADEQQAPGAARPLAPAPAPSLIYILRFRINYNYKTFLSRPFRKTKPSQIYNKAYLFSTMNSMYTLYLNRATFQQGKCDNTVQTNNINLQMKTRRNERNLHKHWQSYLPASASSSEIQRIKTSGHETN